VRLFASSTGSPLLFHLLESGAKGPAALIPLGLSSREAEVLYWIAEGKTHPEIATILGAAIRTVHKHAENIYRKLNLENRAAAMRLALETLN
jgi:DNA-binding CsgD family transcriptional regulator